MPIGPFTRDFLEVNPGPAIENKTAELFVNEGERLRKEIDLQSSKAEAAILGPILATSYTDAFQKLSKGDTTGFKDLSVAMTHASTNPFLASMSKEIGDLADTAYKSYMDQTLQTQRLQSQKDIEDIQQRGANLRAITSEQGQQNRYKGHEAGEDRRAFQARLDAYERDQNARDRQFNAAHNAWAKDEEDRQNIIRSHPEIAPKMQARPEPTKESFGIDVDGSQRPQPLASEPTASSANTGVPEYDARIGEVVTGGISGPPLNKRYADVASAKGMVVEPELPQKDVNINPDATTPQANLKDVTATPVPSVSGVDAATTVAQEEPVTIDSAAKAIKDQGTYQPVKRMSSVEQGKAAQRQFALEKVKNNSKILRIGNTGAQIWILDPPKEPESSEVVNRGGQTFTFKHGGDTEKIKELNKDRETVEAGLGINTDFVHWMGRMGELGYEVKLEEAPGGKGYNASATNDRGETQFWTDAQTVKDKDGNSNFYPAWSREGKPKTLKNEEAQKHFKAHAAMQKLADNGDAMVVGFNSQKMTPEQNKAAEQASQKELQRLFDLDDKANPSKYAEIDKQNAIRRNQGWTPIKAPDKLAIEGQEKGKLKEEQRKIMREAGFDPDVKSKATEFEEKVKAIPGKIVGFVKDLNRKDQENTLKRYKLFMETMPKDQVDSAEYYSRKIVELQKELGHK